MLQILSINPDVTYTCGDLGLTFSGMIPYIISMIVTIIKFVVPILLVIFGMIDMAKAVMAQKEDDIKKGQQTLIKRVIAAVIVFFVVVIVQMIVRFLAGSDDNSIVNCFNCFVNGTVSESQTRDNGCMEEGRNRAPSGP